MFDVFVFIQRLIMNKQERTQITVSVDVNTPVNKAWESWTQPEHIKKWNFASDEWHCPKASNDLKTGGILRSRMEAKDGSAGFDFEGRYTTVESMKHLHLVLADGRNIHVHFEESDGVTKVTETFETEDANSIEMQRAGWQAILENYKKYTESI